MDFLLGAILGMFVLFWGLLIGHVASPRLRDFRQQVLSRGRGKWETHPCQLPTGGSYESLSAKDKIWQCRCGRRWKYLKNKKSDSYPYGQVYIWEERTQELELAEAEAKLKALEK
mgnify:FL=1